MFEKLKKGIFISKDTRTIEEKKSSLNRLGVSITIINKDEDIRDGFVLGRMKDRNKELQAI